MNTKWVRAGSANPLFTMSADLLANVPLIGVAAFEMADIDDTFYRSKVVQAVERMKTSGASPTGPMWYMFLTVLATKSVPSSR